MIKSFLISDYPTREDLEKAVQDYLALSETGDLVAAVPVNKKGTTEVLLLITSGS